MYIHLFQNFSSSFLLPLLIVIFWFVFSEQFQLLKKKKFIIVIQVHSSFSFYDKYLYPLLIKNLKTWEHTFILFFFFLDVKCSKESRYDSSMKMRCERSRSSRIKNNKVYLQITIFSLIFIDARNLNTIKFKESKKKKKKNNRWKDCGSTGSFINLISILFRKRNFSIELTKLIFYVKRSTIHFVTLSAKEDDARV